MADVKKIIVVYEDGTTKEYDSFVGAFIDDKSIRVVDKDVDISQMALIAHMINKEFDEKMEVITHKEEC